MSPLEHVFPDTANLLNPNPRLVSRELMTRDQFKPVTILNLLAAAWIQFMVHDWFVHKQSALEDGIDVPPASGDEASGVMAGEAIGGGPCAAGVHPPPGLRGIRTATGGRVASVRIGPARRGEAPYRRRRAS